MMVKVKTAAVKHPSGKVSTGPKHKMISGHGKEGFVLSDGKFVGRVAAGRVAKRAGQVKHMSSPALHSSNLKAKKK
jgi:hypothetical protein